MSDLDFSIFDNVVGQRLVDVRRVGLPVYWTQMEVLVEERRELHLTCEYCLRLINAGVFASKQVVALLGLQESVTMSALSELLSMDAISGDESMLKITRKGKELLSNYDVQYIEKTWFTAFDGIVNRPYAWRRDQLLTAAQLARAGHSIELTPFCEKPKVRDIDPGEVWSALVSVSRERPTERLLSIRSVRKAPIRFVPAIALGYKGEKGEAHVAFLVDGRPLELHTREFAECRGLNRPMFRGLQGSSAEATQVRLSTRRRLVRHSAGNKSNTSSSGGRLMLPGKTDEPNNGITIPRIHELATRLEKALRTAKSRVIITTRGVSSALLSSGILAEMTSLLERRVPLWIGLGPDAVHADRRNKPASEWIDELRELGSRRKGLAVFALHSIDATHLVLDSEFVIVGDYDWLACDGAISRNFRERWAIECVLPEVVDRESQRVLSHTK